MNWLNKLERRFGNWYIPNLIAAVVPVQGLVWVLTYILRVRWIIPTFSLNMSAVLHGQVWRLITFIFVPSGYSNPITLLIGLYFYYCIGTSLERQWGGFRFNLYYLVGMVGAWAAALLAGSWNGTGLMMSLFFAFAWLYPNMQVLLFYIIPIKMKWLGLLSAALWAWDMFCAPFRYKLCLLLELAGFLLFFGPEVWYEVKNWFNNRNRRNNWKNNYRY